MLRLICKLSTVIFIGAITTYLKPIDLNASMKTYINQAHPIYITVSLIWDSFDIPKYKLAKLEKFRNMNSFIRINHFVSPSYFVGPRSETYMAKMRNVIQKHDSIGLYLSPNKKVLSHLKITIKQPLSLWRNHKPNNRIKLSGDEIMLSSLNPEDIKKIVAFGTTQIENALGQKVNMAMTSDWSNSNSISEALELAGVTFNFSPIPPKFIKRRLHDTPIYQVLETNWRRVSPGTQLFKLGGHSKLIYVPQSGGSMDYQTSQDIVDIFHTQHQSQKGPKLFHTSIHFQTLDQTLPKLIDSFQRIFAASYSEGIAIKPLPKEIKNTGIRVETI